MNYFEVLEIAPTKNLEEVGKAFLKLMSQYHPDKEGSDSTRCEAIAAAWNILQDDVRLEAYYDFIVKGGDHASLPAASSLGAKVKVFIPIYTPMPPDPRFKDFEIESKEYAGEAPPEINETWFQDERRSFDWEKLVKVLNTYQSRDIRTVGIEKNNGNSVVSEHSWYKHSSGWCLVEAYVAMSDLADRAYVASHKPRWALRSAPCLFLKQGTQLAVDHVVGMIKGKHGWSGWVMINKNFSKPFAVPDGFLAKETEVIMARRERLVTEQRLEREAKEAELAAKTAKREINDAESLVKLAEEEMKKTIELAQQKIASLRQEVEKVKQTAASLEKKALSAKGALEKFKHPEEKVVVRPAVASASVGSSSNGMFVTAMQKPVTVAVQPPEKQKRWWWQH